MRRGNFVLLLFVAIVAAALAINYYFNSRPPLEIRLAVSPLAEDWIWQVVAEFNATSPMVNGNRRIALSLVTLDDLEVIEGRAAWTAGTRPAMWLATSQSAVDYADPRYDLTVHLDSAARTPLVWGGFPERVDVLPLLSWDAVAEASALESWQAIGGDASWQFIKLAYPSPQNAMSGIATLLSGAANYHNSTSLAADDLSDRAFREWLLPIVRSVPNFNSLGSNPAQAMAQRGTSVADIGILPESQWLVSFSGFREAVRLSYPQQQIILDFPLVSLDENQLSPEEAEAVPLFADWLAREETQGSATRYGLRPANREPNPDDLLFAAAQQAGIQYEPDFSQTVQPPDRAAVLSLLAWYRQVQ